MKVNGENIKLDFLSALEESTSAIASLDDPLSILKVITRQIDRVIEIEDCSIILLSGDGKAKVLASSESPDIGDREIVLNNYPEIEKVLETREPLLIEDVEQSPLLGEVTEILKRKQVRSMAIFPVSLAGEMLGVLFLRLPYKGNPLARAPISFLQAMSNTVALALRNFRLRDEMLSETQEKLQAQRLAEQEERFRERYQELFHTASDGLVIIDSRGNVVDVNLKFEKLTGYSAREVPELTYLDLVPEEYHEEVRKFLTEYRNSPESRRAQFTIRTRDDRIKQVYATVEPLSTGPGQALLSLQDITEEIELENQLRRTKDFLENFVQSSVDAIIACDIKGTLLIFNEGAEKITGYKAEDVIGKFNIIDLYEPGGAKDAMKRLRSPQYGGTGKLESSHYNIIGKDGEEIPISVSAAILYEKGEEIGSVGIFHDLRERIRIEKDLRAAQDRLIETEKQAALAELSGATAHELNQPLTSIMGYTELLMKRVDRQEETIQKAIRTINQEAERMANIVKKVGQVSNYQTKDYVGRAKIIDLDKAGRAPGRYENLFLGLRDGLMEFSMDKSGAIGDCIFANPSAVQLFGFKTASELIGMPLRKLLAEPGEISKLVEPLKNSGYFEDITFRAVRADGVEIFVSASANILSTEDDKRALEILCRDVTMRVRMENELRRLKEFSENIVNLAPVGIITIDKDGVVLSMNDREQEIMKVPKNLVIGQNILELITIKGTPMEKMVRKGLAGNPISVPYMDFTTRYGKKLSIRVEGMPLKDQEGKVAGGVIIIDDVTEEKRARLEVEIIAEIARAATKGSSAKELEKMLVAQLKRAIPLDVLTLVRAGKNDNRLYYHLIKFPKKLKVPRKGIFKAKNTLTGKVMDERSVQRVDDYDKITKKLPDEEFVHGAGIHSSLSVPLIVHDRCLGTLNVGSFTANSYSEQDGELFMHVANEFAVSLENIDLVEEQKEKNLELEQKTGYLEALLSAGRAYRISMGETEVVKRFVENIEMLFPSPHVLVRLKLPNKDELIPVYVKQLPRSKILERRPVDATLKKLVRESRDYVYYPNLGKIKGYKPQLGGAKSALIIPLHFAGEILGVMYAESHHVDPFSKGELDLFVLMAQQMRAALRNARLYEQTRLMERQRQELIENANVLIAAVDRTGNITIFNKAFEKFLGYSKEEIIGKSVIELFKAEVGEKQISQFAGDLLNQSPKENFVFRFHRKDGERVKGSFNFSLQKDYRDKVQQYIMVGYDVTDREMLEKQLVQSAKMASLGQMAAGVAHELSNPLTYISSFAQLIAKDWEKRMDAAGAGKGKAALPSLEQADLERLANIMKGVDRIERLLSNLMSFSRLDKGKREKLNINDIVDQALSFTEYELSRGRIKLVREFQDGLPPVLGVSGNLQQVFINLLSNASKAIRETGKSDGIIIIRTSTIPAGRPPAGVKIDVVDNGPGISQDLIEHIFEPFFTTKTKGEGTGLGLSIVQNIVQKHGGEIAVQSEAGSETTFSVTLPAAVS